MEDNIQFSAPKQLPRTVRSNNGADALFVDTLTTLFGIDRNCAYDILRMLEQTEQLGNLRKSIKLLSIQDHNELNNILARYDNFDQLDTDVTQTNDIVDTSDDISKYVNRRSTDSWDPEKTEELASTNKQSLPPTANAKDYQFPDRIKEGNTKSFINFLMNETIINKDDAAISSADDDQFDDNTRQRIKSLMNAGNLVGANKLRAQMRQKLQTQSQQPNPQQSNDPLDVAVDRAKAQYAQALRNRQRRRQQQI